MARGRLHGLLDSIRRLAGGPADAAHSDRHLLQRFAQEGDEDAFAVLMRRHAPLVWGVCRRILEREQDAEDAFQAVFLVLARRANSVSWHNDVGNWLYGVANRVARKLRNRSLRQLVLSGSLPESAASATEEPGWKDVRPVLDEEIGRLPEKYRVPIVLCYLQGKTYGEAARLLGWAEGTVSGRLARARELLRGRLLRRGLAPSATLLTALPSASAEAMPSSLTAPVLRAAAAFARGQAIPNGLISQTAILLAHEVMRSMMLSKGKIALLLLVLSVAGTSAAVLAPRRPPEQASPAAPLRRPVVAAKTETHERPTLKKEWQGKWDANPFAGTTALEVVHRSQGGPAKTYRIDNPEKIAQLMKLLHIRAFRNNIAQGNIPAAQITFHKKDKQAFSVTLDSEGNFQARRGGEIYVDPAFLTALNRHLAGPDGQPSDLTKFLPRPPVKRKPPATPPTLETLTSGFTSFTVQYLRGKQLRDAHITDRKMLDELAKALVVVEHVADKGRKGMPSQSFTAVPKGDANVHWPRGHFHDREHLFVWDIGRLTVKPSFVETLNAQLSRLEGRKIDVLGDNKPPEEQVQRERKFRELIAGARAFRYVGADGMEVVVDRRPDVDEFIKALKLVEASAREWKAERSNVVIEVTTAKGDKVRLVYFDTGTANENVGVAPQGGDLVQVEGIGQIWLDRQWRYRFPIHWSQHEMEARQRRQQETLRLVSDDLPTFVKQVVNLVVYYREGDQELSQWLSAADSRPVLQAMEIDRVEKLDWTKERWQAEMRKLQARGGGMVELTPGLGFTLRLVFSGEKEMLIPTYGRVHLKKAITAKLRHAIESDPDKAKILRLLPNGPEG